MPPKRCPECGRFLANDLVSSLAEQSAPCPRCGTALHPETVVGGSRDRRARTEPTKRAAEPAQTESEETDAAQTEPDQTEPDQTEPDQTEQAQTEQAQTEHDETVAGEDPADPGPSSAPGREAARADSIRPPDLDPDAVRTADEDVLAGWDLGATPEEIASWRVDERPFPTDTVVVLVAALLGGLLGAVLSEENRGRGSALGSLAGLVGAGAARRIWELRG